MKELEEIIVIPLSKEHSGKTFSLSDDRKEQDRNIIKIPENCNYMVLRKGMDNYRIFYQRRDSDGRVVECRPGKTVEYGDVEQLKTFLEEVVKLRK